MKPKNGNQSKTAVGFVCEQPFQSMMHLDGSGLSKAWCFAYGSVALKAIGVTHSATVRALTVQLHSIEERNNLICRVEHKNCNRIIFDWHFYQRLTWQAASRATCCPCFSCTCRQLQTNNSSAASWFLCCFVHCCNRPSLLGLFSQSNLHEGFRGWLPALTRSVDLICCRAAGGLVEATGNPDFL